MIYIRQIEKKAENPKRKNDHYVLYHEFFMCDDPHRIERINECTDNPFRAVKAALFDFYNYIRLVYAGGDPIFLISDKELNEYRYQYNLRVSKNG